MAPQTYYGLNIAWGLGQTAMTVTGATGTYQSSDQELKLDENEVRDQRGNVVAWVGYNPTQAVTIEYVASAVATAAGTAAIVAPDRGDKVTVAGESPIAASNWIVQSVVIKRTNTDVAKITLKMISFLGIS